MSIGPKLCPNGAPCSYPCGPLECKRDDAALRASPRDEPDGAEKTACMDCGKPYASFPLDTTLTDDQWRMIHDSEGGILCANCMVERAARLSGAIGCRMHIELAHPPRPVSELSDERVGCGEPHELFCPHCNPCRHREKLNEYDAVLRALCSFLSVGGYNVTHQGLIDPKSADEKIRWGIDHIIEVERKRAALSESQDAGDARRWRNLREACRPFGDWKVSMVHRYEDGRSERFWLHGGQLDAAVDSLSGDKHE